MATILLDLKPTLDSTVIQKKINASHLRSTDILKKILKLSPSQVDLLRTVLTKEEYTDKNILSEKIKALPLIVHAAAPLNEAISTTGGISLNDVNENFELNKLENTFCMGEMLDWNAPTGGYLLQACFSMGVYIAKHLNENN